jgi:hypothetical protein
LLEASKATKVNSKTEELEKLVKLKENGSISEEEFNNLKSKIINS